MKKRYYFLLVLLIIGMANKGFGTAKFSCWTEKKSGYHNGWFRSFYVQRNCAELCSCKVRKIKDSHPRSLQELKNGFAKDKNNVYLKGVKINPVDTETFQVLESSKLEPIDPFHSPFSENFRYAKDKNRVYYINQLVQSNEKNEIFLTEDTDKNLGRHILKNADPKTFVTAKGPYGKDDQSVYKMGKKVSGVDAKSFEAITQHYAKDKNYVYYPENSSNLNIIPNAEPSTFLVLDQCEHRQYAKDKNRFYRYEKPLEEIDYPTFQLLYGCQYAKDKNHVYYENRILGVADVTTFQVDPRPELGGLYAKDKRFKYSYGKNSPLNE